MQSRIWMALALVALLVVAFAACGGGSTTLSCASDGAMVCTKSVQVDGASETVLASHDGKTLYAYKLDTATSVACTGPCTLAWPALTTGGDLPSTLDGLSGTLAIFSGDNGKQVSYNGHPLYSYSLDTGMGDARGQGAEGGNWSVVTPDEAPLGSPSTAPGAPTPTDDPYGGY